MVCLIKLTNSPLSYQPFRYFLNVCDNPSVLDVQQTPNLVPLSNNMIHNKIILCNFSKENNFKYFSYPFYQKLGSKKEGTSSKVAEGAMKLDIVLSVHLTCV